MNTDKFDFEVYKYQNIQTWQALKFMILSKFELIAKITQLNIKENSIFDLKLNYTI